jgi:hypothetical protein
MEAFSILFMAALTPGRFFCVSQGFAEIKTMQEQTCLQNIIFISGDETGTYNRSHITQHDPFHLVQRAVFLRFPVVCHMFSGRADSHLTFFIFSRIRRYHNQIVI